MNGGELCPTGTIVDPYIFRIPTENDADLWLSFFERLERWSSVFRRTESSTSGCAVASLRAEGLFPTNELIAQAISRLGIESYSALDVQNMLRFLGDRAPYAEDHLQIQEVTGSLEVEPEIIRKRLPADAGWALMQVLAAAALRCRNQGWEEPDVGTVDVGEGAALLHLRGSLGIVAHCDGSLWEPSPDDAPIDGQFDLVQSPDEIIRATWEQFAEDPIQAIRIIHQDLLANDPSVGPLRPIDIGSQFLPSVRKLGIIRQLIVLRKVYLLAVLISVDRIPNGAKVHAVRTSTSGESSQVVRGEESLWRCMVTKRGAGYRLHFWRSSTGIELDEVLVESEV